MRFPTLAAICLPLTLAACSGGDDAADEGLDADEVAAALEGSPQMRPGLYESSGTLLEFDVPGVPASQIESVRSMMAESMGATNTFCLTQEEIDEGPGRMVQQMAESDCTVSNLDVSSNSMSGEMQCRGEGGLNGSVKIDGTMRGDSSTMVMETIQSMPGIPGEGARMKMQIDSRRIGECPA